MTTPVLIDNTGGVLAITWNRPDALNAVDGAMLAAAAEAIETAGPDVRLVLLSGTGRAFCSGADPSASQEGNDTLAGANRLILAMTSCPLPVIAAVNGLAAGVGCSIALAADITPARRGAYFLLAFVNIGLMPDAGTTQLVAASLGRARANRMALLGERLYADVAAEIGLIHKSLDDDAYDVELATLVAKFSTSPTLAYAATKAALNAVTLAGLEDALRRETAGQAVLLAAEDFAEGVDAFLTKRPAKFVGR